MRARTTSPAALAAIVLAAELAAAAPDASAPPKPPPPIVVARPAPPLPKTVWQIADDGIATHVASQLQCPRTFGQFLLSRVEMSGQLGIAVSCNYFTLERDTITLFIVLRPNGTPLDVEFKAMEAGSIVQRFRDARPLAQAEQQTIASSFDWTHVIYGLSDTERVGLWVTRIGNWTVGYQAFFAPSRTDATLDVMKTMTETVQNTAGRHIASCAGLTALPRQGSKIMNASMFPGLSISGALAAKTARDDTANMPNWCVIQPVTIEGMNFLLWRNSANQTSGLIERLTPLSENNPVTVYGVIDTMPQTATRRAKPNLVYDIVVDTPDAVELVGVYEGRPPFAELGRFAQGRAVPLYGKIDKKDGKTDIYKAPL